MVRRPRWPVEAGRRESGENPELSRSGERERKPHDHTGGRPPGSGGE